MMRIKKRRAQQAQKTETVSPEEAKRRRQEYQRDYYLAHREKAIAYQRDYNNRRNQSQRNRYTLKHSSTYRQYEREQQRSVHNAHTLQDSQVGGRFERELTRILHGQCDYAGSK